MQKQKKQNKKTKQKQKKPHVTQRASHLPFISRI